MSSRDKRISLNFRDKKKLVIPMVVVIVAASLGVWAYAGTLNNSLSSVQATQPCSISYQNGAPPNSVMVLKTGSVSQICVNYFYNNSTSTMTITPLNMIHILTYGSVPNSNGTRIVDASSMFSIAAKVDGSSVSANDISLGGPRNVNEGIGVTYNISTTSATPSGIYFLSIDATLYPQMEYCISDVPMLVGNTTDAPAGLTCILYNGPSTVSGPSSLPSGTLFMEISGLSNST